MLNVLHDFEKNKKYNLRNAIRESTLNTLQLRSTYEKNTFGRINEDNFDVFFIILF